MRLTLYTNFGICGTINRHILEIKATYFRINQNELYIYEKNKGFYSFDIKKIYDIRIFNCGYYNHIQLNKGNFICILPKETTKKELLKLLKYEKC